MPIYIVEPRSLKIDLACERSPLIALVTTAGDEHEIPALLREASCRIITGNSSLAKQGVPEGCDAAVFWAAGDEIMQGSSSSIRIMLSRAGRRTLVPVHFNRSPAHELDLVGLQPRIWTNLPGDDCIQQHIRIRAVAHPRDRAHDGDSAEHWARIERALRAGLKDPQAGIDRLTKLWHQSAIIPPVYGALLVRNLIVLSIWMNQPQRAQGLLNAGMDRYPHYAGLPFLAGWIALEQGEIKKARRFAERAIENPDPSFIGAGGEGSYRSAWLLGKAAELQGDQSAAISGYFAGLGASPAFPPSVLGLLRQRADRRTAESLSVVALPGLARSEPEYAGAIFSFLLLHGNLEAARRILDLPQVPEDVRPALEQRFREASSALRSGPRPPSSKPGVLLSGPFNVCSSLARINRELGSALAAASTDIEPGFEPYGAGDVPGNQLPHFEAISRGLAHRLSRLDLTIRLHWPPDFNPPPCGKLVSIVPWEFSAVPVAWLEPVKNNVDELWVLSQFNKESFVRAGISPDRIQVIPPGIDTALFKPEGPSWRPDDCRSFVFLFVGGAIPRKGADILWNAYQASFTSSDDVSLVIKEAGANTFYRGQSLTAQIRTAAASKRGGPHVLVLKEELDDGKLAALYRGSSIFVLPYRGEGFGMPLAEALACGTPVIATGLGPAREFCPPEASWFIPARISEIETSQSTLGPMSGPMTWFEPDTCELARIMRHVYEHRSQILSGTTEASERIRKTLNWDRVTGMMLDRIRLMLGLQSKALPGSLPEQAVLARIIHEVQFEERQGRVSTLPK